MRLKEAGWNPATMGALEELRGADWRRVRGLERFLPGRTQRVASMWSVTTWVAPARCTAFCRDATLRQLRSIAMMRVWSPVWWGMREARWSVFSPGAAHMSRIASFLLGDKACATRMEGRFWSMVLEWGSVSCRGGSRPPARVEDGMWVYVCVREVE